MKKIDLKKTALSVIALVSIVSVSNAFSQLLIVTSNQTQVNTISENTLRQLYSARITSSHLVPIDSPADSLAFKAFYHQLFNWSVSEVTQYRSSLLFSGKGTPPQQANSTMQALDKVSHNKNLITYATAEQVNQFGPAFLKVIYPANNTLSHTIHSRDDIKIINEPKTNLVDEHIVTTQKNKAIAKKTQMDSASTTQNNQQIKNNSSESTTSNYSQKELGLAAICAKGCTPEQIKAFLNHKNQVNLVNS
ncbi:hypothetical protein L3V82_08920 [Thiotrichales bacterium 19S3-7]|nr:hypothetical protein [Thiotrichales bacterium 19S3-7]MCF6802280.1 hypothetical protein [Thiotrichales bacterium 19S3-11]